LLLSDNVQSEYIAAGKVFKERYYRSHETLRLCRPVLLSGKVQSEHVAAGKVFNNDIIGKLTL